MIFELTFCVCKVRKCFRSVQQHRVEIERSSSLALRRKRSHVGLLFADWYQGLLIGAVLADAKIRSPFGAGVCSGHGLLFAREYNFIDFIEKINLFNNLKHFYDNNTWYLFCSIYFFQNLNIYFIFKSILSTIIKNQILFIYFL